MSLLNVVCLCAAFFSALTTGALVVNWLGLARAMLLLTDAGAYTAFHQATNRTFDPYMPLIVMGAIIGNAASFGVATGEDPRQSFLAVVASVAYLLVLLLSLATNVRLNKQIAKWSVHAPPETWAATRRKWVQFHIIRTLVSVPALVSCLLAVIVE